MTEVSITRQQLADIIGTMVQSTIRITSKWQQAWIIGSSRNRIVLAHPEKLRKIVAG